MARLFDRRLPMLGILMLLFSAPALALNDDEVDALGKKCEAARSKALAPIRAERVKACKEQQLRSPGHCERYYQTYGNVAVQASGAPTHGYFYDLPECQKWLQARQELHQSRSRP